MSDTERVFALYVQVNPVPDPDLLTTIEAELLEGSTAMETTERIESRPPERARRWKPATVVAVAFIVVLALGVVGSVLLFTGDGESEPVAAADARPVVTFDGESCTYDGPTRIIEGWVEFTLVNSAGRAVTLSSWGMSAAALADELERTPVGTDRELLPDEGEPTGSHTYRTAPPGGEAGMRDELVVGNTYLIDCTTTGIQDQNEYQDHLWRTASIEVVAP